MRNNPFPAARLILILMTFLKVVFFGLLASVVLAYVLLPLRGRYINLTSSIPPGIYRLYLLTEQPIRRGILIAFLQPPRADVPMAPLLPGTYGLLKYVAGMEGDTIDENTTGVWINGHKWPNSEPRAPHYHPYIIGRHVVPRGTVWALGTNHESIDSRYFGDVSIAHYVKNTGAYDPICGIPASQLCAAKDTDPSPSPCYLRPDSIFAKP
jgi:type IV secretory pathway protease TraF